MHEYCVYDLPSLPLARSTQISSLAALISAAVAVGTFNDLDESGSVVKKVRAASGWIIFIAVVAMTIEIVSTILRLLDPEGKKSKLSYILGDYVSCAYNEIATVMMMKLDNNKLSVHLATCMMFDKCTIANKCNYSYMYITVKTELS